MAKQKTKKQYEADVGIAFVPDEVVKKMDKQRIEDDEDEEPTQDERITWLFNQFDGDFELGISILKEEYRYKYINHIIAAAEKAKENIS